MITRPNGVYALPALDYAFDFDDVPGLVVVRLNTPNPTAESTMRSMVALVEHPRFGEGCGILANLLEMEFMPTFDEAKGLAEFAHVEGLLSGHRMAYAIHAKHLEAALVFEATAEMLGAAVGVFESVDEAREWLLDAVDDSV